MQGIGSGLVHRVDDCASGASKLGGHAVSLDLELLDGILGRMMEAAFMFPMMAVAPSSMNSLVLVGPPVALQSPKLTEPEVAGATPAPKSTTPGVIVAI